MASPLVVEATLAAGPEVRPREKLKVGVAKLARISHAFCNEGRSRIA